MSSGEESNKEIQEEGGRKMERKGEKGVAVMAISITGGEDEGKEKEKREGGWRRPFLHEQHIKISTKAYIQFNLKMMSMLEKWV